MLVKNLEAIELKKSRGSKKDLVENLETICKDIREGKNLEPYSDKKEDEKKLIEFYKHSTSKVTLYNYNTKDYHYTVVEIVDSTNSKLNFIIRDDELTKYFKSYFTENTQENIQKLQNSKIVTKLDKFDFLVYNDIIVLLHLNNDFTVKEAK